MPVLNDVLAEQFVRHGDRIAAGSSRETLSYAQLSAAAEAFGTDLRAALAAAVGPDAARHDVARILIYAGNSPRYVVAYLGCLRAGAVPFLIDPVLGAQELGAVVRSCGIDLLIHDRVLPLPADRVRSVGVVGSLSVSSVSAGGAARPELSPNTEVCRFTSGSTGEPSCIEFSGTAVVNAATAWNAASGAGPDDRILCFAGLFNGLAFNTSLLPAFLAGASLWLPTGLPSAGHVVRFLREVRPTRLTGFPALYESLLRRDGTIPELAALRVALSSAAPMAPETLAALRDRFGLAVCNYYGIAEAGPLTFDPAPPPDGGLGFPLPGVELVVGAPAAAAAEAPSGELLVRSTSMGTRYLNVPDGFARKVDEHGWYHSGDQGFLRDGRLFLTGRGGKGLNLAGRKVDAGEIRIALLAVPGVTEVAVFLIEKSNGDPMLVAAVSGAVTPSVAELRAHCSSRLAPYKVPERFLVLPELPTTSLGKPRMSALEELAHSHGTGD